MCIQTNEIKPGELQCEYLYNPLGIETLLPRLSWVVNSNTKGQYQKAYQIIVASNEENLNLCKGDLWDSGKVLSNQSLNIVYEGAPLISRQRCYWKVKTWCANDLESTYSDNAWFEMGLLQQEDWKARWIGSPKFEIDSPLFRKDFQINKKILIARAYVTGVGYYELSFNGKKVGDHVLDPAWTDYSKSVLYSTYEVEEYLSEGKNTVGIILGKGWFNSSFVNSVSTALQMLIQIEISFVDGTLMMITSDTHSGWLANSNGPIISNSIYDGEKYDARLEMPGWDMPGFDICKSAEKGQEWKPAISVEAPGGKLVSQMMEPIKVVMEIKPVTLHNPKPGVFVYDFGQNISGWVRLTVEGAKGEEVTMKYSELLYEDGSVNRENLRTAKSTDTYILKGQGVEVYEPRFTYHGFRYVQIEGFPGEPKLENILGRVVRSAVEPTGSFKCSNELINKIQACAVWTEADNLMGLPTDCPQRDERLGWLNDATVRTEEAFYNFKLVSLFKKWEQDIADTQGKDTGAISDTAPFYRFGRRPADPVCITYLIVPWLIYLHYGDKRVLETNYAGMKNWVEYLGDNSEDYIVTYSTYGDWASPLTQSIEGSAGAGAISAKTPGDLMSTGYYYYCAILMSKIAKIMGNASDAECFIKLAKNIKEAFNNKFLDKERGCYATNNQASNVFPLYLGIVPEENKQSVINHIVKDVMEINQEHLTTGNLCSRYIMDVLTEAGRIDVAYTLATQTTYPSWGYMIMNGATTIWERWEHVTTGELCAMASHNHPMYASISAWFYKMLAGINVSEEGPGYEEIVIKPYMPVGLDFVEASVKTVRGMVKSSWAKTQAGISMDVCIPFNCSALIYVPVKDKTKYIIKESEKEIWKSGQVKTNSGVILAEVEGDNFIAFKVLPGTYSFTAASK